MKRRNNFIVDDDESSSSEDSDLEDFIVKPSAKRKKISDSINNKLDEFRDKMKDREVTFDKILKANLAEDDIIWFIEHLDILDNLEKYTEDYYRVKTNIYNKFKELEKNHCNKELYDKIKNIVSLDDDIINKYIIQNIMIILRLYYTKNINRFKI